MNGNHSWKKIRRDMFFEFSPCFSVKFGHFGEHFSPKTPMECAYVCLLLDLLISLYFIRKFTRILHCLHQITTHPPFPRLVNTLCLDSFLVCCQLIFYISNVAIISKAISLSNIFRNADFKFYLIFFCKWIMNLCVTGIQWLNECDWKQKPASVCVVICM